MLFSYFKKLKKNKLIKGHIERFRDDFSEEQKTSILASLYSIAKSDLEYHRSEDEFIVLFADAFGYSVSKEKVEESVDMDSEKMFAQLNTLSNEQKEWYVITIFGMINADDLALEEELLHAKKLFNRIGIPLEEIKGILKKAKVS